MVMMVLVDCSRVASGVVVEKEGTSDRNDWMDGDRKEGEKSAGWEQAEECEQDG